MAVQTFFQIWRPTFLSETRFSQLLKSPQKFTVSHFGRGSLEFCVTYWSIGLGSYTKDEQIFQKYRSHFKIVGAKMVTLRKFHIEYPQILGATFQNFVVWATRRSRFMHPCLVRPSWYVSLLKLLSQRNVIRCQLRVIRRNKKFFETC
jgi:hypothetical protein